MRDCTPLYAFAFSRHQLPQCMSRAGIRTSVADIYADWNFKYFPVRTEEAFVPSLKCIFKRVINTIPNPNSLCHNPERPQLFTIRFDCVLSINVNFKTCLRNLLLPSSFSSQKMYETCSWEMLMNFLSDCTPHYKTPEDNVIPSQHREKSRYHTSGD